MAESYSCQDIRVLRGLEAVRRRPGMYVGDTDDGTGLEHMVTGVIDWGVEQHMRGAASYVRVAHVGDAIVVEHDGDGLVVANHPDDGKQSFVELATLQHGRVYPAAFREVMFPGLVMAVHVAIEKTLWRSQARRHMDEPDVRRLVRTVVSRGLAAHLDSDGDLREALLARIPRAA